MVLGRALYLPMGDSKPKLAISNNETLVLQLQEDPYVYGSNFTDVVTNLTRVDYAER